MSRRSPWIAAACVVVGALGLPVPTEAQCGFQWAEGFGPPGGTLDGPVYAMTEFDDGGGPALFVAGDFASAGGQTVNRIAKWDGAAWSPLGTGMSFAVGALSVFDDGTGPALYAGGWFTAAGGVLSYYIARWGPSCPRGDLNCDGSVNPDDIGPFALALTDPASYVAAYPNCDRFLVDLNGDGLLNGDNVPLFVAALLSP